MEEGVFTVGHGTRAPSELVDVLASAGVERVVDVRRFPASRRHPHFARASMEEWLPRAGVAYEWRGEELGGRRSRRKGDPTRHPAWREPGFRGYADHMDTEQFRRALEALERDSRGSPTAVMCAETLWWRCHRRLIADALHVRGLEVVHLLDPDKSERHKPHPALRVDEDGWPVYDVGVSVQLPL